jgi:hypothetical protein
MVDLDAQTIIDRVSSTELCCEIIRKSHVYTAIIQSLSRNKKGKSETDKNLGDLWAACVHPYKLQ